MNVYRGVESGPGTKHSDFSSGPVLDLDPRGDFFSESYVLQPEFLQALP